MQQSLNIEETNRNKEKEVKMGYYKSGRTYYRTKAEALRTARKGDRIYYDAFEKAYYLVRTQRRKRFWW